MLLQPCPTHAVLFSFTMTVKFFSRGQSPLLPNTGSAVNTGHVRPTAPTVTGWITFVFTHANLCL